MNDKNIAALFLGLLLLSVACIDERNIQTQASSTSTTSTTLALDQGNSSPDPWDDPGMQEEFTPFSDENETVDIGQMI